MLARLIGFAAAITMLFGVANVYAADLNDTQIAHIAYTAGQIDIAAADLALEKSSNEDVRRFAENMVSDHTAVNEQALALVEKLGVTPEDNETSQTLSKQADLKRAELVGLSGPAFDRAYVENEVAYHQAVNDALANLLIPAASNEELKALLSTGLEIFTGHQQHAENVLEMIQ